MENLNFDNTFVRELPADPELQNNTRQVYGSLFSYVSPTPTSTEPYLVAYSREVCELLDLDPAECERPEFPLIMSGSAPLPGSKPYAQCYGGHQFGTWAGQLGDGRAITLGEVVNRAGQRWELQLKGAGKTPYSRRADGRAVMRSSVREYVASEAMHHLGIPTTRALSLVGTGDQVLRDMFYNGNARFEPGAVVCRVAPSFVRFGTFQLPVSRGDADVGLVKQAADYVIRHHYPHLKGDAKCYAKLLEEVAVRTAELVTHWQGVGFVHGVLNTDNMSILGLTIDYGPYGFMDKFDPYYTPNVTDFQGRRYAYRNQPEIGQWNCVMLGNALLQAGLMSKEEAEAGLNKYSEVLTTKYNTRMATKLGLRSYDRTLTVELMKLMYSDEADFTNTFRALGSITSAAPEGGEKDIPEQLRAAISAASTTEWTSEKEGAWLQWLAAFRARLREDGMSDVERKAMQDAVNPKFIPRQHLLQYAIEGVEAGDFSELNRLMDVLKRPYDEQPAADPKYSGVPPEEMVRPGVCVLSCSS